MNPKIISVVDLTHLQPQERMHIIGNDIVYKPTEEADCPSHTGCNLNQSCACQTDSTANVPPRVINTVPLNKSSFILDPNGVEIRIDIDKAMDSTTLGSSITILPEPSGEFDIHYYDLTNSLAGFKTSLSLVKKNSKDKLQLLDDTSYTVTLKGTAKGANGKNLDGNGDGTGGDDFTLSFSTVKKYDSCICQSDCSCVGYVCSCQSYTPCSCVSYVSCTCQSNTCYYCSCQYAGCTLYRV